MGHSLHNDVCGKFDIHFCLFCCVLKSIVSFLVYRGDYFCWIIFCGSILFTNFSCLQRWRLIMLEWLRLHISSNPWMNLFIGDLLWIVYVRQLNDYLHAKIKVLNCMSSNLWSIITRNYYLATPLEESRFECQVSLFCTCAYIFFKFNIFHHTNLHRQIMSR